MTLTTILDNYIDQVFRNLNAPTMNGFPYYNIVDVSEDNKSSKKIRIDLAVAGCDKNRFVITESNGNLRISYTPEDKPITEKYLYHGISGRKFVRTFAINSDVEVKEAEYVDGILSVYLEQKVQESSEKKIQIK